jgi:hypothetical protein
MRLAQLIAIIGLLYVPASAAYAAGAHDAVGCAGCHARKAAEGGFAATGNTTYLDPSTNQPFTGSTAICLACHQTQDQGGQDHTPVSRGGGHPWGIGTVNPRKARLPDDMRVNGRLECMSCHDPHPSNSNYMYLRLETGPRGKFLDRFCAICHLSKAGDEEEE